MTRGRTLDLSLRVRMDADGAVREIVRLDRAIDRSGKEARQASGGHERLARSMRRAGDGASLATRAFRLAGGALAGIGFAQAARSV